MKLTTAHDLGLDRVEAMLQDRRLARRVLALAAAHIQVSEGVLELMRNGSPERQLLAALFLFEAEAPNEIDLEHVGVELDQAKLEALLLTRAFVVLKQACETSGLATSNTWGEIRRALNLDLPLTVKTSSSIEPPSQDDDVIDAGTTDDFVVIATRDEVKAETGAALVVRQEQALVMSGRKSILDTPEGHARVEELLQGKELALISQLFDLPGVADPDQFEQSLLSLALILKNTRNHNTLITRATSNFADRPRRSRKVIAQVMKRYGLNAGLMENIVFLCEEGQPSDLQVEAINMVVKALTARTEVVETMMAAVTLIRVLEEEPKAEVRRRAIICLAEKAAVIATRLPCFLEEARAIPIVRTLLITSPKDYRKPVERLLLSFGVLDSAPIEAALTEDLDAITNPFVLMTFYLALEAFTSDLLEQRSWATKRWALCLQYRTQHPELLAEGEERFQNELPGSMDTITNILTDFPVPDQVYFVGLLDRSFHGAITRSDAESAGRIVKYLVDQLVTEEVGGALQLAILKTETLLSPRVGANTQHSFWPKMRARFEDLRRDEVFVRRLIQSGRILLAEVVDLLATSTPESQVELASLCYDKVAALDAKERKFEAARDWITTAVKRLSTLTAGFLTRGGKPIFPFDVSYRGVQVLTATPVTTSDMVHELATAAIAASVARGQADQLLRAYELVHANPLFESRTLDLFSKAFLRILDSAPMLGYDGICRISAHPANSTALFFATFVEMMKVGRKHPQAHFESLVTLAASPFLSPEAMADVITHMVDTFLSVLNSLDNMPDPPKPDGTEAKLPKPVGKALTGLETLASGDRGSKLSEGQRLMVRRLLERLIAQRPEQVMTRWVKGGPPPEKVADHYKDALQGALAYL